MSDVKIIKAPARIYLTIGENFSAGDYDFASLQEVLWCEDRQGAHDLEYVLADATWRRATDGTEMQRLKRRVMSDFIAASGVAPTGRVLEAMRKALDSIIEGLPFSD